MKTARAAMVILALSAMAFALAARRGRSGSVEVERQPPPLAEPPPAAPLPSLAPKIPLPAEAEVARGMRRAFGDAVRPVNAQPVLVGDFNGDGAEDVALPVRPAEGRLSELNDEVANWSVQDALEEERSRRKPSATVERARVEQDDLLLAVVHGIGPKGWRDEDARQCYLVRHATGAPLEARPRTELLKYVERVPNAAQLEGHVIFCSSGGRPGFLFWTGRRYAWHPLPARPRTTATTP